MLVNLILETKEYDDYTSMLLALLNMFIFNGSAKMELTILMEVLKLS